MIHKNLLLLETFLKFLLHRVLRHISGSEF